MTVISHANCADGFCAAFLIWLVFPDAKFFFCKYGDPVPDIGIGENVIIVDFSFPPDVLKELEGRVASVRMMDHHKTAIEKYSADLKWRETTSIEFDVARCGARMCYDWLLRSEYSVLLDSWRWLVGYVEDRDLWKWELRASREVSAAIASWPREFEVWKTFSSEWLIADGAAILRYQKQLLDSIAQNAQKHDFNAFVNSPVLQSELGERLAPPGGYCDVWWIDAFGDRVHSLRSKDVDVSIIAGSYGGGGHRSAAGYKETGGVR